MKTAKQKLEILFNEMKRFYAETDFLYADLIQKDASKTYQAQAHKSQVRNLLFKKLVQLSNFDGLPQIFADKDYKELVGYKFSYMGLSLSGTELFRGSRNAGYHANILFDKNYHMGIGDVSNGLYFSTNPQTALSYTREQHSLNLVLKLKAPELKIIDDIELQIKLSNTLNDNFHQDTDIESLLQIKKFFESIEDGTDKNDFANALFDDLSLVAILLGYDAIYDHNFPSFAIFNRGKLCVSQSESERIKTLCGMQPDGMQ